MQMSESVVLIRTLKELSKCLARTVKIVDELLSKSDQANGTRAKRSKPLVVMKRR